MPSSKGPSDNRREAAKACADANARLSAAHQSGIEVGRNEEKARIRAAVEGLDLPRDAADPTYIRGWDEARAAVLAKIEEARRG